MTKKTKQTKINKDYDSNVFSYFCDSNAITMLVIALPMIKIKDKTDVLFLKLILSNLLIICIIMVILW